MIAMWDALDTKQDWLPTQAHLKRDRNNRRNWHLAEGRHGTRPMAKPGVRLTGKS